MLREFLLKRAHFGVVFGERGRHLWLSPHTGPFRAPSQRKATSRKRSTRSPGAAHRRGGSSWGCGGGRRGPWASLQCGEHFGKPRREPACTRPSLHCTDPTHGLTWFLLCVCMCTLLVYFLFSMLSFSQYALFFSPCLCSQHLIQTFHKKTTDDNPHT